MSSVNLMSQLMVIRIHAELPADAEIISIEPSGASGWVQTVRIETRQKDVEQAYFMKVHTNKTSTISLLEKSSEDGSKMMGGIYEGEKALYDYSPNNVPRPMGWGVYASDPNKWFLHLRVSRNDRRGT